MGFLRLLMYIIVPLIPMKLGDYTNVFLVVPPRDILPIVFKFHRCIQLNTELDVKAQLLCINS